MRRDQVAGSGLIPPATAGTESELLVPAVAHFPKEKFVMTCNHHRGPLLIVCKHLGNGSCRDWMPAFLEGEPESYLCPSCFLRLNDLALDDALAICAECVRELQAGANILDPNDFRSLEDFGRYAARGEN